MLNPQLLITLDNLLGILYRSMLYCFIRTRKGVAHNPNDEVVVLKMMGIGSITRIYGSLKEQHVDLDKILFITLASNKGLFKALGIRNAKYINDSSLLSLGFELFRLCFFIRQREPSYVVNYERASNLLGLLQIFSTWFTNTGTISFHDIMHDKVSKKDQIYAVNGRSFQELITYTFSVYTREEFSDKVVALKTTSKTRRVLININASDYMPYRRYPVSNFAAIIESLYCWDNSLHFDLIGSPSEKQYVDSLLSKIKIKDISICNRCGDWSLSDLLAQFSTCSLFITNDSGPMHLAALANTPMIVIWGPTSSKQFGYDAPDITNIEAGSICSPCFQHAKSHAAIACNKRIDCLQEIKVAQVIEVAKSKLMNQEAIREGPIINDVQGSFRQNYTSAK